MQKKLTDEFNNIKQQLDEHLSTINENTFEVQSMLDFLQQIENKVDKLSQRMDLMQLSQPFEKRSFSLNQIESRVFYALYTEESPLSHQEIAVKTDLPVSLIPEYLSALVEKGVPLIRTFYGNKLFLKLDSQFKELQAKENMINLSLESFIES